LLGLGKGVKNVARNKKKTEKNYQDLLKKTVKDNYFLIIIGLLVFCLVGILAFMYTNQKITEGQKRADIKKSIEIKSKPITRLTEREVVVAKGETLWKIAEKNYGSGYNWVDIAKANKITNPNLIFRGMRLKIPDVERRQLTKGEIMKTGTAKVKSRVTRYQVKKGDSLSKIALQVYGDMFAWKPIAKLNGIKNPNLIYPSQVLRIP